jgi:hypothetical protein
MGDLEVKCLLDSNQLPASQPYQAIIQGKEGRVYSEKYLKGQKKVDTRPSTVVEFIAPEKLIKVHIVPLIEGPLPPFDASDSLLNPTLFDSIQALFAKQHKAEDGVLSHGLGHKAARTLPEFNKSLSSGMPHPLSAVWGTSLLCLAKRSQEHRTRT